jgi:dienelactone hydrolase
MYGDARTTTRPEDAVALMQAATASVAITRQRFVAGLDLLLRQPQVDPQRIGAIGYCFGGKLVLDMARQGLPLAGVVSFHGRLTPAVPATPGSVRARVLVEHGEADSMTTPEQLQDFQEEMRQAGADYRLVIHPGARHGFTNPQADERRTATLDIGYQREADERSWEDMKAFFAEVFV